MRKGRRTSGGDESWRYDTNKEDLQNNAKGSTLVLRLREKDNGNFVTTKERSIWKNDEVDYRFVGKGQRGGGIRKMYDESFAADVVRGGSIGIKLGDHLVRGHEDRFQAFYGDVERTISPRGSCADLEISPLLAIIRENPFEVDRPMGCSL
uniref:Uncharacterized protein n=1 Tax=Vespula pensylvanica TaxID=30213 RepID=A0A834U874_VESPE|nr:hypothetical protein H0235_010963 [Vespula pensylvanica]